MAAVEDRGTKTVVGIGAWLVVVGAAALVGYGVYETLRGIFSEPDVPVLIQVAIPACVAGVVILLGATFIQMMKRRKSEGFEEVEY